MAEEKTAEELKDQEKNLERFMFLVDGCNDGIWDWDINTGEFYFFLDHLWHIIQIKSVFFRNNYMVNPGP